MLICPPIEELHRLLIADYDNGTLTWKPRRPEDFRVTGKRSSDTCCRAWNTKFAGKFALNTQKSEGYLAGNLLGVTAYAHRVLWAMKHGEWPDSEIDHINGIRSDNRLANLRAATPSENMRNRVRRVRGPDEYLGVTRVGKKYRALIGVNGRTIHLGYYDTKRDAATARDAAALLVDGKFARLNL